MRGSLSKGWGPDHEAEAAEAVVASGASHSWE